jgi:hypothetical protein
MKGSEVMSGINGDKARFNRQRKNKIARRARDRKLFKGAGLPKHHASSAASAQKGVSA